MQTSRVRRAGVLVAALTLLAAACGGDDDTTGTDATQGGEPSPATEAGAPTATGGTTAAPGTSAAGGNQGGGQPSGNQGPLTIGALMPQSGQLASIGSGLFQAVRLGAQEVNAVGDTTVNVVTGDSGTDPNVAGPALNQIMNRDPSAIIGAAATDVTMSIIDRITGQGIVECSGSNTGAALTDYQDNGFYFRTAPSDVLQGPALADVIAQDGYIDVAIVYRNDEYGAGFNDSLTSALQEAGANVVASVGYDPNATSYAGEAQEVASANPEAVALISFEEGAGVLQAMIGQGVGPDSVQYYVTDGFAQSVEAADVDPNNPTVLQGIKGTAPSTSPENGEPTFLDRFSQFAGPNTPTIFAAQKYDCLMTIVLASEQAGSTDPADIQANMIEVTRGGEKCSRYKDCHALVMEGTDIDYDGASGPLDFTDVGEPSVGAYDVYSYNAKGEQVPQDQTIIGG